MVEHNMSIGARIKSLRVARKMTLKQLSDEVGFSIGYLSQLERGMSSIAIDSLARIAEVFGVNLSSFFDYAAAQTGGNPVVKSFDLEAIRVGPDIAQYILSKTPGDFQLLPRLFVLLPNENNGEELISFKHEGEEFMYVLEGIVTAYLDGMEYILYPGDSLQIHSNVNHNWCNRTNKVAKLLTVNFPNALIRPGEEGEAGPEAL